LFSERKIDNAVIQQYNWIELTDGTRRQLTNDEKTNYSLIPKGARLFRPVLLLQVMNIH
jgi:hypothetical protein